MLRINLLVAVAVAAGVVGCAQCDTCDDFPAPCTGPNCGQPYSVPAAMTDPAMTQGGPVMGTTTPVPPGNDSAGPAPVAPPESPGPDAPPAGSGSPPTPMDPAAQPK
jgi:hypothetical protein